MRKVLAVSGYKAYELGIFQKDHPSVNYIKKAIKKELAPLVEDGLEWLLISGQLGIELWAAEVIFEMQMTYPDLKLAVITPFLDQEAKWNEQNQEWYESILAGADFIDSVSRKPYEKPWQFRLKNQFFIEKSDA
ncbi:MAG: SLOG family protein, partial [Bacillota bacterium]|nr:SLOG family protein [Bacillota bacterium]